MLFEYSEETCAELASKINVGVSTSFKIVSDIGRKPDGSYLGMYYQDIDQIEILQNLSPDQFEFTLSHELAHAVVGLSLMHCPWHVVIAALIRQRLGWSCVINRTSPAAVLFHECLKLDVGQIADNIIEDLAKITITQNPDGSWSSSRFHAYTRRTRMIELVSGGRRCKLASKFNAWTYLVSDYCEPADDYWHWEDWMAVKYLDGNYLPWRLKKMLNDMRLAKLAKKFGYA